MKKVQPKLLIAFVIALALLVFMIWRAEKSVTPGTEIAPTSSSFTGPAAGSVPHVRGPSGLPPR